MKRDERLHLASRSLIDPSDSLAILQEIFYDSIILDFKFNIQSIGHSVVNDLGYHSQELLHQPIELIVPGFSTSITSLLAGGYFTDRKSNLLSKQGTLVSARLSGFYTGLLTDVNGLIFLRYESQHDLDLAHTRLEAKEDEMDHFVYQASHSLRGPLATIRGLINIAKTEQDPQQLSFIHEKMDEFANRLDTKLYKLMCFAWVDRGRGIPTGYIQADQLRKRLVLEAEVMKIQNTSFLCSVDLPPAFRVNEHLIESLMLNLVNFILTALHDQETSIVISISEKDYHLKITIHALGFYFSEAFEASFSENPSFGNVLEQPDLISAFSAHKVIKRFQGKLNSEKISANQSIIEISIPYNFISLSKGPM